MAASPFTPPVRKERNESPFEVSMTTLAPSSAKVIVGVAEGPGAEVEAVALSPTLPENLVSAIRLASAWPRSTISAPPRLASTPKPKPTLALPVGGANEIEPGGLIFASSPASKRLVVLAIAFHGPINGISATDVGDCRAAEAKR